MISRWTSHLKDEEDKQLFRNSVLGARDVLERLRQMVEEDEEALNYSEANPKSYSEPNWDYRQAHKNGMRQQIYQIKAMINLDRKENTL